METLSDNDKRCVDLLCQNMGLDENKAIRFENDPPDFIYDKIIGIEHTKLNYNYPEPISPLGIEAMYWKLMHIIKSYSPPFGVYPDGGTSSRLIEQRIVEVLEFLKKNQWNISTLENVSSWPDVRVTRSQQSGDIIITDKNGKFLTLRFLLDTAYRACCGAGNISPNVGDNITNAVTGSIVIKTQKLGEKDLGTMRQWLLLEDTHYHQLTESEWIAITKDIDRSIFERIFVVNTQTHLVVEL